MPCISLRIAPWLLILVVTLFAPARGAEPAQTTKTADAKQADRTDDKERPGAGAGEASSGRKPSPSKNDGGRRYTFRRQHDPNGIGKFYMDREIAHVMGYAGVNWLERPEREEEEALTQLIDALKFKPGMVVADIGAGSGVLTLRIAAKVGKTGKVVAVDVQQEMLDLLAKKLKQQKIDNVELVLGTEKSPRIPKNSLDLVLMVDVYHEFAFPYEMLLEISTAMKPGGRVVFVEYRKEDPDVPIKLVHKMTQEQVKREAAPPELRLKYKETIGVLPQQHIVIFEREDVATDAPASK